MIDDLLDMLKVLLIIAAAILTLATLPFFIAKVCDEAKAYNPPPNRWQLLRQAWDDAQERKAARRAWKGGWHE